MLSVERKAGSGIVRHQGLPLIIPLNHMRPHVLQSYFFNSIHENGRTEQQIDKDYATFFINPHLARACHEVYYDEDYFDNRTSDDPSKIKEIMDIADGTMSSRPTIVGNMLSSDAQWRFIPDEESVANCRILNLMQEVFKPYMAHAHGIIFGTQLKRLPSIPGASRGIWLRWSRQNRRQYHVKYVHMDRVHVIRGRYDNWSYACLYSFTHEESMEQQQGLRPNFCLLYTSPSPRDGLLSRMPSSA